MVWRCGVGDVVGCDIRGVIIRRGFVKGLMVCLPLGVGEIIGRCDGGRDMMIRGCVGGWGK